MKSLTVVVLALAAVIGLVVADYSYGSYGSAGYTYMPAYGYGGYGTAGSGLGNNQMYLFLFVFLFFILLLSSNNSISNFTING